MRRVVTVCFLILAACQIAQGQSGPDNDPAGLQGFIGEPFATANPDSINLFNGQLTVPIALGPSYPIGPNLRFQVVLTYNSRVWELGHPSSIHQSSSFAYTPITGNPALGIGWNFSLGAVKLCSATTSTYCYVGPDGGQHIFDESDAARGTGFSKPSDGARLSLKNNGTSGFEMWDEAGNHYLFETAGHVTGYDDSLADFTHDFGRGRDGWYLTKLEDPFHNNFTVAYYTSTPGVNKPCWTYTGTPSVLGAIQCPIFGAALPMWIPSRITVPAGTGGTQDIRVDLDPATSMINQFEFPILGGGTAAWTLGYDPLPTNHKYVNDSSGTMNLETIISIGLPAGLGGSPSYAFSYFTDPCPSSGLLARATLPTLATIDYQYRTYNFYHTRIARFGPNCLVTLAPDGRSVAGSELDVCSGQAPSPSRPYLPAGGPCDASDIDAYLDTITKGVGKRTLTIAGVPAVTDYYEYSFPYGEYGTTSTLNCDPIGRCGSKNLTIVVSPEVDLNGGSLGTGRRTSRAVLFSVASDGAGGTEGAPIEDRLFDHDVSVPEHPSVPYTEPLCGPFASSELAFCADKAIRVIQRSFDYGDDVNTTSGKRRLHVETTFYQNTDISEGCTGCPTHQVTFSNSPGQVWDAPGTTGNGRHYNIETHGGTLANSSRTITTTWSPQVNSSVYLPDLFTERTDILGTTRDELFEFDPTTGFPTGTLIFDQSNHRVWVNCRFKNGQGNVGQELTKTFGSSSAPANTYCSSNYGSTMPSVGQDQDMFGRSYSYQNGEILAGFWLNGTSSIGWNQFTLARDASTGWVTAAADSAGASTAYVYDSIGRTTSVTPPGEAALAISYSSMTQTTVQRNGGGLTTYEEYDYDGAARLVKQRRQMPGSNQYSKRFFQYDGRGNPYFASNWVADSTLETVTRDKDTTCSFSGTNFSTKRPSAAPGVYQLCFDPFGRPQQAVGANFSSLLTVDRTSGSSYYSDVRTAVTFCVNETLSNDGSCGGGLPNATTTTTLDAFGRATNVVEPSGDSASYSYDVNDNLTSVTQGSQTRSFTYDAFGLLRQETTPEKGSVTYDSFGSLGNLRQATEPGILITLRCYDAAGRVTSVRSNETVPPVTPACGSPGAGATYLGFTYDQNSNPPSNYSLGRLTQRQSFNPLLSPLTTVKDDFTYGGAGGRISQQTTTVSGGSSLLTTQTWLYNSLGLVAQHYHPRVSGSAPFVVSVGYDAGLPVAEYINGIPMITGVGYQPSGLLGGYRTGVYLPVGTFGQNVATTIGQDSVSGRLTTISAAGGTSSFSTGSYAYDGAGNITGMGSDVFSYDNRSRLTQAYLAGVGSTNCQHFDYDSYGNLWRYKSGSWNSGACSASSTTNLCASGTCAGNRLDPGVATYDNGSSNGRGNLTANLAFGNEQYAYDGLNRVLVNQSGPTTTNYYYDGSSERIARVQGTNWTYTLRDGQGRLTTEISGSSPTLDNVFLGNQLVASYAPGNTSVWAFYTADHLGTPRLITDLTGNTVETRRHWPYGGDVGTPGGLERLRFAGMERDLEGNHYYDHARSHDFNLGRFLTPDILSGASGAPQSWNRYSYVLGSPLALLDPLGLTATNPGCTVKWTDEGPAIDCPAPIPWWVYPGSWPGGGGNPSGGEVGGGGLQSPSPSRGPCKGVGLVASYGGAAAAGIGPLGVAAQGSAGAGAFLGSGHPSLGGFASGGAFAGGPGFGKAIPAADLTLYPGGYPNIAWGAFLGYGPSLSFTNAGSAEGLKGPFATTGVNIGYAGANLNIQLAVDPATGIFTFGVGLKGGFNTGISVYSYQTGTAAKSLLGGCPK